MCLPLRDKMWLPTPQCYFVTTALIILQEVKYEFIWVINIQKDSEFSLYRVQVIKELSAERRFLLEKLIVTQIRENLLHFMENDG
jgi:hypothetical protein